MRINRAGANHDGISSCDDGYTSGVNLTGCEGLSWVCVVRAWASCPRLGGATGPGAIPAALDDRGGRRRRYSFDRGCRGENHGELPSHEIPKRPAQATRPAPLSHQCQIATALQRWAGRRGCGVEAGRRRVSRHHLPGLWLSPREESWWRHGRRRRPSGRDYSGSLRTVRRGPSNRRRDGHLSLGRGEVVAPLLAPLG